jgi:predicted ATP-dependent protease
MKRLLSLAFTLLIYSFSFSQNAFNEIKLEEANDYALAEPQVLKAVNYLFSTKYDLDDLDRLYAMELVMKWIAGTPDFSFELNEKFVKPFVKEGELMNLYMSAMARIALENKERAKDVAYVSLNAVKAVLEYSNKSSNNIKQSAEVKKMAAALKKGELEKYLGI